MTIYSQGSRGEIVRQIQRALNLYPDGIYGRLTAEAVRQFQAGNGLTPDGIVGPATLARLIPQRLRKSKRNIKELIVHCTATPEGKDFTVADIRRWHKAQGWSDIGYHYVIYRDGTIQDGRSVDISGAHCEGHNTSSIGIVYIGGCDKSGKTPKDTRTEQQKAALLSLLLDLRRLYPFARIAGHRDFSRKSCPSFDAAREYRLI